MTDESGKFELTNVPPGTYEIVAWHEGWGQTKHESAFDVLTEQKVERPIFTEPRSVGKESCIRSKRQRCYQLFHFGKIGSTADRTRPFGRAYRVGEHALSPTKPLLPSSTVSPRRKERRLRLRWLGCLRRIR